MSGGGSLQPAELSALRQLYNATGGPQGAWLNDTGWRDEGGGGGAPDPCDGRSWFGIYDWFEVKACTEPDNATHRRSLQVLSLDAAANAAGAGNLGNGLRGNLGEWSMLRGLPLGSRRARGL